MLGNHRESFRGSTESRSHLDGCGEQHVLLPLRRSRTSGALGPTFAGEYTKVHCPPRKPSVWPLLPGYNRDVRWGNFIRLTLILLTLGLAASASDQPSTAPLLPCAEGSPGAASCNPSKKEIKEAGEAFAKGLKLQREKRQDEAFDRSKRQRGWLPKMSNM